MLFDEEVFEFEQTPTREHSEKGIKYIILWFRREMDESRREPWPMEEQKSDVHEGRNIFSNSMD